MLPSVYCSCSWALLAGGVLVLFCRVHGEEKWYTACPNADDSLQYCLGHGTCLHIPLLDLKHCLCDPGYRGERCQWHDITFTETRTHRHRHQHDTRDNGAQLHNRMKQELARHQRLAELVGRRKKRSTEVQPSPLSSRPTVITSWRNKNLRNLFRNKEYLRSATGYNSEVKSPGLLQLLRNQNLNHLSNTNNKAQENYSVDKLENTPLDILNKPSGTQRSVPWAAAVNTADRYQRVIELLLS